MISNCSVWTRWQTLEVFSAAARASSGYLIGRGGSERLVYLRLKHGADREEEELWSGSILGVRRLKTTMFKIYNRVQLRSEEQEAGSFFTVTP